MAVPLLQLEELEHIEGKSFRIMTNVKLSDFYFWHFHPEIELVYITASQGLRQVGTHSKKYSGGDLVLIGSGIPHLNFDYLLTEAYNIVVIHLHTNFLRGERGNHFELTPIIKLLEKARYGLSFSSSIRREIGPLMFELAELSGFVQYTALLNILFQLSKDRDITLLHDHPYQNDLIWKEQHRLKDLYQFIDENYMNEITLHQAAEICHLSNEAFCRYFKKATKSTFISFLNRYRIAQAKRMILRNESIGEVCYKCGFESSAYFSRVFKNVTGETASSYRNRMNTTIN